MQQSLLDGYERHIWNILKLTHK